RVRAGDRPVAAEAQLRAGGGQAAERVLPRGPLGTEERQRQLGHLRLVAGPQRLAVGEHPEAGGPGHVIGVDGLEGRDVVPASRAAAIASSASRTARSPIAWMCTWTPRASMAVTASFSSSGAKKLVPRPSVSCPWPSR